MVLTRILFWMGGTFLLCAGMFALTIIVAGLHLDFSNLAIMTALACAFSGLGGVFIMLSSATSERESKAEALLFLVLYWTIVPAILALPFQISGASPTWLSSYFESVSAFTTTGATRLNVDALSPTLKFWRALVQFIGGVSVATFAVVILAALNQTGTGVHRSLLFTIHKGALLSRLTGIGRLVAGVYAFLASVGFILMVFGGAPAFDALCLVLSGISTGGLTPRMGPLHIYIPPFAATVLAVLCLLGAMNIAVIWDVLRLRQRRHMLRLLFSVEHRALLVLIALLIIVGAYYTDLIHLGSLIIDSVYFVSSAGFQYWPTSLDRVPSVILVLIALIGGSALSTAGGVKLIRMLLLFRRLSTDLSRLSHPSRVVPVKFRSQILPDASFLSVWMYSFVYTLVFGLGIVAFGATGLHLEDAIASSAASLSNLGPLLGMTLPETGLSWAEFGRAGMAVSILLMILGRIEILAALALFFPNFWTR